MKKESLAFEQYRSRDSDEPMMRIGAAEAPAILFVPPLFEELNRTRALIASIMRRIASEGLCGWLPDLSGTGESLRRLAQVEWDEWRDDVGAAAHHVARRSGARPLVASLRGGALLDDAAEGSGWWRLAPATGASLHRDMVRSGLAGVEWAGFAPAEALKTALAEATPAKVEPLRLVQLKGHAGQADAQIAGPSLWRRSEPATSEEMAAAAAADLVEWSRQCAH